MPSFLDRMRLLPASLLALSISYALAADGDSKSDPNPLSIPPSQQWDGIDGSWSSFGVKLGTPPQDIRTFVSWNAYQTWAVIPEGCEAAGDYDACAQARGGIFNQTASTTWDEEGLYSLLILQDLGYYGNGYYGFDVERLGGKTPSVRNSTITGFALEDFYLGVLGINPKPTNFSADTTGSSSYMTLLKEQEHIPSISFGYTAGAQYREGSVDDAYGSLTLGGYDDTKFVANDVTFDFASDPNRDVVVALQSVYTPSADKSNPVAVELLPDAINIYLDATVPQIWLPIESCYVFEYVFGLVYDNDTELYLVNNTLHQTLLSRNASITFQLATDLDGGSVVLIELPYAAFDLTAKSPYQGVSDDTYYFPLRRAMNESQYTIGRAFFQEAYIAVDYESQKFNVSQRAWDSSSDQHLIAIPAYSARSPYPGVATPGGSGSGGGLSGGAIAGIVVGVVALLVLVGILCLWLFRRRRSSQAKQRAMDEKLTATSDTGSDHDGSAPAESVGFGHKAELPGSVPVAQEDSNDRSLLASGALSTNSSSSPGGIRTPRTPNALSGQTFVNGRWNGEAYSPSTDTPEEGTGTHSSTDTSSRGGAASSTSNYGTGSGTLQSLVSPLSPVDSHEADGTERHVFEMAGDMPAVKEKDGHEMSEKEALAHREKVYNGVEQPPSPTKMSHAATGKEVPSRVSPEEVVRAGSLVSPVGPGEGTEQRDYGLHRQFSFEGERARGEEGHREGTEELYK